MQLRSFLTELTKIADAGCPAPSKPIPINATPPRGPRVPTNGLKLAYAANAMAPPASPQATQAGASLAPARPSKLPGQTLNPVAGAVPNHPAATHAATVPPPPPPTGHSAPPASGVFPTRGVVQPPGPVTAASGRAYAASRAALAGPKRPPMLMKVGEDPDGPKHGQPGHDHKASVQKLRAVMQQKHPHLLEKKADLRSTLTSAGKHLVQHEDAHEIAGLATLALPSVDNVQARLRGGGEHDKRILPEVAHDAMEIGGLGYLASPMIAKKGLGKAAVQAMGHA